MMTEAEKNEAMAALIGQAELIDAEIEKTVHMLLKVRHRRGSYMIRKLNVMKLFVAEVKEGANSERPWTERSRPLSTVLDGEVLNG